MFLKKILENIADFLKINVLVKFILEQVNKFYYGIDISEACERLKKENESLKSELTVIKSDYETSELSVRQKQAQLDELNAKHEQKLQKVDDLEAQVKELKEKMHDQVCPEPHRYVPDDLPEQLKDRITTVVNQMIKNYYSKNQKTTSKSPERSAGQDVLQQYQEDHKTSKSLMDAVSGMKDKMLFSAKKAFGAMNI